MRRKEKSLKWYYHISAIKSDECFYKKCMIAQLVLGRCKLVSDDGTRCWSILQQSPPLPPLLCTVRPLRPPPGPFTGLPAGPRPPLLLDDSTSGQSRHGRVWLNIATSWLEAGRPAVVVPYCLLLVLGHGIQGQDCGGESGEEQSTNTHSRTTHIISRHGGGSVMPGLASCQNRE